MPRKCNLKRKLKRKLTLDEIEDILSFIKPIENARVPFETLKSVAEMNKENLKQQLIKQRVYPSIIPELKKEVERQYYLTMIQPGESVGIFAAHSLGHAMTQETLNTFHKAGLSVSLVVSGVAKFSELLSVSKNPKMLSSKIYLKNQGDISDIVTLGNSLTYINVKKLLISYEIKSYDKCEWYDVYCKLYNKYNTYSGYILTLKFDKKLLYDYTIYLQDIADKIEEEIDNINCIASPLQLAQIDIHTSLNEIEILKIIPIIEKVYINGIEGIEDVFFLQEEDNWIIETHGSNFPKLLSHESFDNTKTISNFVWDIYNILGIEAAREYMIESFLSVMSWVNVCHIELLTDIMTQTGTLKPISRHSMLVDQTGPLSKASFEETMENLLKAGLYGENESTKGISSSIICGKLSNIGTGMIDLIVDTEKLK